MSPSGSSIWLNCPRSARLSRGVPRRSSKWADEGTLAHELAEHLLRGAIPQDKVGTYPDDMVAALASYIKFVADLRDLGLVLERIEDRVNLDGLWPDGEAPESVFGTADYVAVTPGGALYVVDLKYGANYVVEVGWNSQLMIYALGVWLGLRDKVDIRKITIAVVQPRAKHHVGTTRWHVFDLVDLLDWAYETLVPAVELIAGDTPDEDLPLVEGSHCKWCPAASGVCPAKHGAKQDKARQIFDEVAE